MSVDVEGDILDGGGNAPAANIGGMFGEYDEFRQGNDVVVARLGTREVAAAFRVLFWT